MGKNKMEPTISNVEQALAQFYHSSGGQHEVHKWLTQVQISPQAWTFCWQLLGKDKALEVQFFGASTLHVKISRYWGELPTDHVEVLRAQLLEHIVIYAAGPKMVLTQLCVALSSFIMHTTPVSWPGAIENIIQTFQPENLGHLSSTQVCLILLEILKVLPEEFQSISMTPNRRGIVRNELHKDSKHVLSLLKHIMSTQCPNVIYKESIECLSSWVQFGVDIMVLEDLVNFLFDALGNVELFENSIDCLVHVFSQPENHRYPTTISKLIPKVLRLSDMLHGAIERHDTDATQALVRLIVSVGDNNTKIITKNTLGSEDERNLALQLVQLVMVCTGIPGHYPAEENCSDLTFAFWYNLQDDIQGTFTDNCVLLCQVFTPTFMSLADVLLQKVQYPPDEEYDSWTPDEKEQFRCYRQDISDTFMYIYNMLNLELLTCLCRLFSNTLSKPSVQLIKWQEVEAVIFAMKSIAECVPLEEEECLPAMFRMLAGVPCDNQKLISQALSLIGSYAEWICHHPGVLGSVLPLLLQGLKSADLAESATMSLKEVVRENQEHLKIFVPNILSTSKEALDSNALRSREMCRLMGCLGYVLSVLNIEEIMEYLNVLLAPHIDQLCSLGNMQASLGTKNGILIRINMLCWLFGSLNIYWEDDKEEKSNNPRPSGPQPVVLVLQQVLPVLEQVVRNWVLDEDIVEATCRLIKQALRTLMDDFKPLSESVSKLLVQIYNEHPHPALIDLAKQMVILLTSDEACKPIATYLFQSLCSKCLCVYEQGIQEQPDVAESFMVFLAQVAKKNPVLFYDPNCDLNRLFKAGVTSLAMSEHPTVKGACQFLSELLSLGGKNEQIKQAVVLNGHEVVQQLVRAIAGESPRAVTEFMPDVFLALNRNFPQELRQWLAQISKQEGFPHERATKEQKEMFASRVLRESVTKRRVKELVAEYTLLWRGLLGTEYGAQTSILVS